MDQRSIQVIEVSADGQKEKKGSVVDQQVKEFGGVFGPLESERLFVLSDLRTNARFCECHIKASRLIQLSTVDVPLDPEEQPDYRANREMLEDHIAFHQMKADARQRRTFSNLVAEYNTDFDEDHPLKIIGGQHRFAAIQEAFEEGIDEYHGVKVYFQLDSDQRLDVQLISNTNISVSTDLYDRMQETVSGPELRDWCQTVGLLEQGQDFADKRQRGAPITVRIARTFVVNYYKGTEVNAKEFDKMDTSPYLCVSGGPDPEWEKLRKQRPRLWHDKGLKEAGTEFASLIKSQRAAHATRKSRGRVNIDFSEKAMNYAVLSAWAYVSGVLQQNQTRLKRHYALRDQKQSDPLNAAALARGRHKTDPDNYRGLGYRTDPKERGRFVELFFLQAEKGEGISKSQIDIAIKKYHAKQAILEVLEAQGK